MNSTFLSHTPQPREAPRAVFDDEEEQEPIPTGHPNHPMRVNKPLSSVGSSDHNRNQTPQQSGLFVFFIFNFEPIFFLCLLASQLILTLLFSRQSL